MTCRVRFEQNGRVELAWAMRHTDPLLCPIGALARYFVLRAHHMMRRAKTQKRMAERRDREPEPDEDGQQILEVDPLQAWMPDFAKKEWCAQSHEDFSICHPASVFVVNTSHATGTATLFSKRFSAPTRNLATARTGANVTRRESTAQPQGPP
jgi:hypothetical protein